MSTLATFLFTISAFAMNHQDQITIPILIGLAIVILLSCMFGDSFDYFTGYLAEHAIEKFSWMHRFYRPDKMAQGQAFFERYGPLSIVLASCVPVLHSCVSLAAGGTKYPYWKFISWNTGANLFIVTACVIGGYWLGNVPFIKGHLLLIIGIGMLVFILPGVLIFMHQNKK